MSSSRGTQRQNLHARLRLLSDDSWLQLLVASLDPPTATAMSLPGFPESSIQIQFTGSDNAQTLQEAFAFYALAKRRAAALDRPLGSDSRLLDFGVGWGRLLRIFLRDIATDNLFGCDIDPNVIDLCRQLGVPGNLDRIYAGGKLPYPDAFFDIMVSYSVFTHLPEPVHRHWLEELARVARPGCVFVLTLEPRSFIDLVAGLGGHSSMETSWHAQLAKYAELCPALYSAFDKGQIAYIPTGGGGDYRDTSVYGDAVVPLAYIKSEWSRYFEVCDYIDNDTNYCQAVLIVRRR